MTKYVKGQSGNPAGRPKGSRGRFTVFRDAVEPSIEALVDVLIKKALEGDMAAMRLLLERTVPRVQAESPSELSEFQPVKIELVGVHAGEPWSSES